MRDVAAPKTGEWLPPSPGELAIAILKRTLIVAAVVVVTMYVARFAIPALATKFDNKSVTRTVCSSSGSLFWRTKSCIVFPPTTPNR